MSETNIQIELVSDATLDGLDDRVAFVEGSTSLDDRSIPLWVVEHEGLIDTYDLQEQARLAGRDVLVCSFHRHSVRSIGPCECFVGSVAAVASASGFTVHCDADIWRAARDLRGRLAAKTVAVLEGLLLHIVDAQSAQTVSIADLSLTEIFLRARSGVDTVDQTSAA